MSNCIICGTSSKEIPESTAVKSVCVCCCLDICDEFDHDWNTTIQQMANRHGVTSKLIKSILNA